jgi:outer membrane receptor protein involved in Fe transport
MDGIDYTIVAYVENVFDEEYYHANPVGTSVVQFMQPPRTGRIALQATF